MTIRRTFDGRRFSIIANLPKVRPLLGGEGDIDLRPAAADPNNVFLTDNDEGGFALMPLYPGAYEAHTIFPPMVNAKIVVRLMRATFEYMFLRTDCEVILTKVPDANPGAIHLGRIGGFVEEFRREGVWHDGGGISYQKLSLDTWARACSTVAEQGHRFHELLETRKKAEGSEAPVHPDDEAHDRAAGVAVSMIKVGNTVKGVNHYNKWAIFAGYGQIKLLSEQPVIVDTGDAIMGLRDGELEVIQCR